jgi:hypothetical protein
MLADQMKEQFTIGLAERHAVNLIQHNWIGMYKPVSPAPPSPLSISCFSVLASSMVERKHISR